MSYQGKKPSINYTFNQSYSNWGSGPEFAKLDARARTFDILTELDNLETEVYADRDYTVANKLIANAGKRSF